MTSRIAGCRRGLLALALFTLTLGFGAAESAERARRDMVAAASPLAAEAGRMVLRQGGNAIDAAIATALALGVVEPQSSGIGGGGFLVYYAAKQRRVVTFDGRETAPAAAKPDRFLDAEGKPLAFFDAVVGGRSVGVPGLLRMLALAHRRYGKLRWALLFAPAIQLAENGFPISPRLYAGLAEDRIFAANEAAKAIFYAPDGTAKPEGAIVVNRDLAQTLRRIADAGADSFYRGPIAKDIVAAVHASPHAGDLAFADLAHYRAIERAPICGAWRAYRLCGMGPPSSGAVTVLEILGLYERAAHDLPADSIDAWHVFAEASRLAYADRARYLGDPAFVDAPIGGLLDSHYLAERAKLIDPQHAHQGKATPGEPPRRHAGDWGDSNAPELPSTSSIAIVDGEGNALALTATIENEFGARIMVRGFLLNNELTDFSFVPDDEGRLVANRVEPGKRPLSAMAPTIAFDDKGAPVLAIGSAGGPAIITDVAKSVLAVLGWGFDLERALALPNIGNRNGTTDLEATAGDEALARGLAERGHALRMSRRPSGLSAIRITPQGLEGAADPRRDGAALGD